MMVLSLAVKYIEGCSVLSGKQGMRGGHNLYFFKGQQENRLLKSALEN